MADRQPDAADPPEPAPLDDASGEHAPDADPGTPRLLRELPALLVVALLVAILVKTFVVQVFVIPSVSMEPTLRPGDRVLVCRACRLWDDIQRGDVIVFADPAVTERDRGFVGSIAHFLGEGLGVARPESEDFIKRVIGLPGDVVELNDGRLFVNGVQVDEPYLSRRIDTSAYGPFRVPDGMLFVLGDNRTRSGDSRYAPPRGVGLVPIDRVIGEAFVRVWPPPRIGGL